MDSLIYHIGSGCYPNFAFLAWCLFCQIVDGFLNIAHGIIPGCTIASSAFFYVSDASCIHSGILVGTDVDGASLVACSTHDVGRGCFQFCRKVGVVFQLSLVQKGRGFLKSEGGAV